jgi:hypothetical protein
MQLKNTKTLRRRLGSATCALLGVTAPLATPLTALADTGGGANTPWKIDSAIMFYSETDRVSAVEPVISITGQVDEDNSVNVKLVLDALTGASPNGATPTDQTQTFTRPSGNGSYTAAPGEVPLDDTFRDTRAALGVTWKHNLDRLTRSTLGANVSAEFDFTSLSFSGGFERDYNGRNTTLTGGVGIELDQIKPKGGVPTPFTSMSAAANGDRATRDEDGEDEGEGSTESKTVVDALFGITQVINRQTLMQFNYSISASNGYHTDPFKIISVVDGTGGTGDTLDYVYENRPDSRLKQALYWQTKYHLTEDVIDFSYRYMWDDWGVDSHTFDMHYRYELGDGYYLEPHLRYYLQSAADFYVHSLRDDQPLPTYASADPRLGEFVGTTIGLKYSQPIFGDQRVGVRVELYQQDGDGSPSDAIGSQRSQDLFPDLEAWIVQFNYSFLW